MPHNRVAVALWTSEEDGDEVLDRFGGSRPNVVVGTLANAVRQVEVWQQSTRKV